MKSNTIKVEIMGSNNKPIYRDIEGYVFGNFGVHRPISSRLGDGEVPILRNKGWSITHIASGKRCLPGGNNFSLPTLKQAKKLAIRIDHNVDAEWKEENPFSNGVDVNKVYQQIQTLIQEL